jgi:hypothetical protein
MYTYIYKLFIITFIRFYNAFNFHTFDARVCGRFVKPYKVVGVEGVKAF